MVIGKRSQKREETRQEILAAAAKLFGEKGYGSSSVEDIANAADVVKGTFYYNFSSKEDVVIALRHQSVEKAIAEAETLSEQGQSAVKCIEHYLIMTCRWSEENPELASVLFSNGPLFLSARQNAETKNADAKNALNKAEDEGVASSREVKTGPAQPSAPPLSIALKSFVVKAQQAGELNAALEPGFVASLVSFIGMHTHLAWAAGGMQGSACEQVVLNFRAIVDGLAVQT